MKTVFKSAFKLPVPESQTRVILPLTPANRPNSLEFGTLSLALLLVCGAALARADSLWPSTSQRHAARHVCRPQGRRDGRHRHDRRRRIRHRLKFAEQEIFPRIELGGHDRENSSTPAFAKHGGELPGMSATGKSGFSGGGDVSNSQSLSARAAVLVTDVLPNGNLVIQGVRVVTFSGETQYVVLHGMIRQRRHRARQQRAVHQHRRRPRRVLRRGCAHRRPEARLVVQGLRKAPPVLSEDYRL
jgi:hypothetical protein